MSLTTSHYAVSFILEEGRREHVVSTVARIKDDQLEIGAVQLFLDEPDTVIEPVPLGRALHPFEEAWIAGQVAALHARDRNAPPDPARCQECGGTTWCDLYCPNYLPW